MRVEAVRMNINKRTYSDGRVRWRARYPDPTRGGKKQIERQFETRREAEKWLTSQRAAIQRGEHIDPKDHHRQFEDVADAWEATWLDLEPKTKAGYKAILNRHVLPRWRGVRIGAVTPEAIQEWLNGIAAERHANTVRRIYSVLRAVMKLSVERRYLLANPCDAVRLPRAPAVAIDQRVILSASEVATLADAINSRYRLLIYAAAYTGLRAGELGALRRRDLDLLHGTVNVERALKDVGGRHIFGPTKTAKARRVGMPKFLVEMFTEYLSALDGGPDALVFRSPEGGPLRHHNMYVREFKPTVRAALPPEKHGLRFHDLRHTCASLLIAAGAHPKAIQEHLGHKDIQTTFNVYGHLLPSAQKALAAALDAAFDGGQDDNVHSLPAQSEVGR
jgi:integrase